MKDRIRCIQRALGVDADGIVGPQTLTALEGRLGIAEAGKNTVDAEGSGNKPQCEGTRRVWPTQAQVRTGKSIFGAAGDEGALVNIVPPYPLYYDGRAVKSIRVHERIAHEVQAALTEILAHYGQERIHELGLDVYGGSYNYRATTGGSSLSMHAWGIAFDFDPERNAMGMHAPQATLSRPECEAFWEIWERHGAVSMGRTYDKDWMHLQFARF